MCSLQISVLLVCMKVDISLINSGIVGSCGVFACNVSVCYFVAYGVWQEFVCVAYLAYWYVLFACLV